MTEKADPYLRTADLVDARADTQVSRIRLNAYGGLTSVAGVAETIRVGPTLGKLRGILGEHGYQRVLVVDAGGESSEWAVFGDRMAARAVANGWQGIVIDGLIRDVANLATLDLGVWAMGTCPRAAEAEPSEGDLSVPLLVGGAQVMPGWWVVCDPDGFVSCPSGPDA